MNLLFQVAGGWGDKRKFKWMWRWFSNRVNPTVWQTHGIAFLTREYQLFYSIKVNEMCLLLEMLLAYTAHQLLAFFSQWYMVNGEDLLPVSPERARDQLLLSGSLVVMMVELQEPQGGGAFNLEKDNWGMFYCWVSSGTRQIDKISALHKYGDHGGDEKQD